MVEMGVTAGNNQRQERESYRLFQKSGKEVTFNVMNTNKWNFQRSGDRFGCGKTDQQSTRQTGSTGNGDTFKRIHADSGF